MLEPGKSAADVEATRRNAALAGISIVVQPVPATDVWPEHWAALQVAQAMGTQWNVGPSGRAIGYRYEALPLVFQMLEVPRRDRPEVFAVLQVLEAKMKSIMRERTS